MTAAGTNRSGPAKPVRAVVLSRDLSVSQSGFDNLSSSGFGNSAFSASANSSSHGTAHSAGSSVNFDAVDFGGSKRGLSFDPTGPAPPSGNVKRARAANATTAAAADAKVVSSKTGAGATKTKSLPSATASATAGQKGSFTSSIFEKPLSTGLNFNSFGSTGSGISAKPGSALMRQAPGTSSTSSAGFTAVAHPGRPGTGGVLSHVLAKASGRSTAAVTTGHEVSARR